MISNTIIVNALYYNITYYNLTFYVRASPHHGFLDHRVRPAVAQELSPEPQLLTIIASSNNSY